LSFRLRVTLLTAAAVAVAAIGASVAMYLVVQDQLMHQVEANLVVAAQNAARGGPGPGDGRGRFGPQSQFMTGRPDMYAQIITASGTIFRTDFDTPNTGLVVQEVKDVASGKRAAFFATADAQDTRLAMYVVPIQGGGAIEVVQDLAMTGIDAALAGGRGSPLVCAAALQEFLHHFADTEKFVQVSRLAEIVGIELAGERTILRIALRACLPMRAATECTHMA